MNLQQCAATNNCKLDFNVRGVRRCITACLINPHSATESVHVYSALLMRINSVSVCPGPGQGTRYKLSPTAVTPPFVLIPEAPQLSNIDVSQSASLSFFFLSLSNRFRAINPRGGRVSAASSSVFLFFLRDYVPYFVHCAYFPVTLVSNCRIATF